MKTMESLEAVRAKVRLSLSRDAVTLMGENDLDQEIYCQALEQLEETPAMHMDALIRCVQKGIEKILNRERARIDVRTQIATARVADYQ